MAEDESTESPSDADESTSTPAPDDAEDWSEEEGESPSTDDEDQEEGEEESEGGDEEADEEDADEEGDDDEIELSTEAQNLIKRLKAQGKSDKFIINAISKDYWERNNSAGKTARKAKELEEQLGLAQEELDELRESRKTPDKEEKAVPAESPAGVKRAEARVNTLKGLQTEKQEKLGKLTDACEKSHSRVVVARARLDDAGDDERPTRRRELSEAVSAHNSNVERYESIEDRLKELVLDVEEAEDRLQSAKAAQEHEEKARANRAEELNKLKGNWKRDFISIVNKNVDDLGIPDEDRDEFIDEIHDSVVSHLRRKDPNAPAEDLSKLIPKIIERKQKTTRFLHAKQAKTVFSEESKQKLKTVRAIKPNGTPKSKAPEGGRPAQRQTRMTLEEQNAAAKKHAERVLSRRG